MKNQFTRRQEIIADVVRRVLQRQAAKLSSDDPREEFYSPHAQALKEQIVAAGKKLWHRQYVDGNGGNISARLTPEHVICTPTMLSKGDLCVEDLSLVDLDNRQVVGDRPQTSEIRLHLEIYKEIPDAQAVIHCHPPYATAYAMAGVVPPGNLLPEQEVFVGPVVLAPYETPGTQEFARTIFPMAHRHNTILLANHGIVCWADTVMHAEWLTEVIDTYCKTVMIASQLRPTLPEIPSNKIIDLLAIKKRYGLPDPRIPVDHNSESPSPAEGNSEYSAGFSDCRRFLSNDEVEELVSEITLEIVRCLEGSS